MLSSLEALNAAGSSAAGRSAAFQPKAKPRVRKPTKPTEATEQAPAPPPGTQAAPTNATARTVPNPPNTAAIPPPSSEQRAPTASRSAIPRAPSIPAVEATPSAPPPVRRRLGKEPVQAPATPPETPDADSGPSSSREPTNEKRRITNSTPRKRKILETIDEKDLSKVALKDLIKFAEARERKKQREDAAAKKLEQANPAASQSNALEESRERVVPLAPQVRVVNGNIVIDEASLQVNARDLNQDDLSSYRRVEETQSKLNYHTGLIVPKGRWNKVETEMFYKAVEQFGTDFEVIQKLFPSKTRRQIKAKYKKEERENPRRMTDTILNPRSDMAQYEELVARLKAAAAEKLAPEDEYDTWNTTFNQDAEATPEENDELNHEEDVEKQESEMDEGYEAPKESPVHNASGFQTEDKQENEEPPPLFAFQSFKF